VWKSRPVFISSTFADMQAERDYLRTRVFPELEERLRTRRHYLEWVDLRVGIATASERDEHVRELHVLKVCLDEVKRCRPFLIVLLGDRYGWVPPEERIKAVAVEARFSTEVADRSVTDLEIEFGVLSDPEQQPRSFFYFREPLPYAEMPTEIAALYCEDYTGERGKANRKERLVALKRRIAQRLPARIRRYTAQWDEERSRINGLEDFGRMVLDDIWSELDAETQTSAAAVDIPWQLSEREALQDFIDDRARDFVGRRDILNSLIGLATGNDGPAQTACVTGEPGSGKSALFGELYRLLHERDIFLVAHSAGASVNAASVDSMLRRWIGELAAGIGIDSGLADNADPDAVDMAFAQLLSQMAQRRRVVVLVDALDQFENTPRGRFVTWLPRLWPANARLVATAVAGEGSKALVARPGLKVLSMPSLDAIEARDIVAGICGRYHRTFEPDVVDALLSKRSVDGSAWSNPLWLVLAVEELNLLDADDFAHAQREYLGAPSERLRSLMLDRVADLPADIIALYAHTLKLAEGVFGTKLARGFLSLIAVSRTGWRETDFRVLLPRVSGEDWDELKYAQLRRLFRGQLRRRGALAQWDFNHAQMRVAVRARLSAVGIREAEVHSIIADHLLSCSADDPLHIREIMVHLLASGDHARAANYYGNSSLGEAEVQGATRVLAEASIAATTVTPAIGVEDICRLLDTSDSVVLAQIAERLLFNLSGAIDGYASFETRLILLVSIKDAFDRLLRLKPYNIRWQHNLTSTLDRVGDVKLTQGDLAGELESRHEALAIAERLAKSDLSNGDLQHSLSVSYQKIGDSQMSRGDLGGALNSFRHSAAIFDFLAKELPNNAKILRDRAVSLLKIGHAQMAQRDLAGALKSISEGHAIFRRLAILDSANTGWERDLATSFTTLGDIQSAQGDLVYALSSFRKALEIANRLATSDPRNMVTQRVLLRALHGVGHVQAAQGDLASALKSFREAHAAADRLAKWDPGDNSWHDSLGTAQRVAEVQIALGDSLGALRSFREALDIAARTVESNPLDTTRRISQFVLLSKIGDVQLTQGNPTGALISFRDGLAIADRLAKSDPGNVSRQLDLSVLSLRVGDAQALQSELAGALKFYQDGLDVLDRLAKSDPDNIVCQTERAVAHSKIASVLKRSGDRASALAWLRRGQAILQRLMALPQTNADWQGMLTWFNGQIAELSS
jgi:tetratricopeptide (TPR) repeat protein